MKDKQIGSYRLLELLGAGGMGEVYSAYDNRLDRRVAIKVVRPDLATKASTLSRFRREARVLARVNHPYLVQIFEVLEDEDGLFLVMELLEGETLRQILEQRGPLPLEQVVEFGKELAEGLEAIHGAGLIHRDLKTDNVMVTTHGHLKILDFGLAKPLKPQPGESTVSTEGRVAGTYAAMSPEQAQGQPLDPRTDFFSLGLLLYEMTTGEHPFEADSAETTLVRICRDLQTPIYELRPDLPRGLSHLIDQLLSKVPEERPSSAGQVRRALETLDSQAPSVSQSDSKEDRTTLGSSDAIAHLASLARPPTKPPSTQSSYPLQSSLRNPRRLLGLVVGVILVLWISTNAWNNSSEQLTLAVLEPIYSNGDAGQFEQAWYSSAIPRILADQLTDKKIRVLDPDWVLETRKQLGLSPGEINEQLWQALEADAVITGSYLIPSLEAADANLELRLRRKSSSAPDWSFSGDLSPETLWSVLADTSHEIRQVLNVTTLTPGQAQALAKSWPTHTAALELYGQGLNHLSRLEGEEAEKVLKAASDLDPDSTRIWGALAEAYRFQGRSSKALEASRRLLSLVDRRSNLELLDVQARVREDEGRWQEAATLRKRLLELEPQDLVTAWRLAFTLVKGDRLKDALDVLEQVRNIPGADRDPRFPLLAARVRYDLGDVAKGQGEAERAERLARDLSAPGFLGQALLLQILPAIWRGDDKEVERLRLDAMQQLDQTNDRVQIVHIAEFLAFSLREKKDLQQAETWYRIALRGFEELGYVAGARRVRRALGAVLSEQGRSAEAKILFHQDLIDSEEDTEAQAAVRETNQAANTMVSGDLNSAETIFHQCLDVFGELRYPNYEAVVLTNLAEIEFLRAHLSNALEGHRQAKDLRRLIGQDTAYNDLWIARIAAAQGQFGSALKGLRKLATRGDTEARIRLSEVWLHQGRGASARQELQTLIKSNKLYPPQKATAQDLLARSELALGLPIEAERTWALAVDTALGFEIFELELHLRITGAMIKAELDPESIDEWRTKLQELAERAEDADFRLIALEARLAKARLELERLNDPRGLENLVSEAQTWDLEGLASRAQALLDSVS